MLREAKRSIDEDVRSFPIDLTNVDTEYFKAQNFVDIIIDIEDDTIQLECELILSMGWNIGKYTGVMKFLCYLNNYLMESGDNITRIVMTEDTTNQINYQNYAGINVTFPSSYIINRIEKRFVIRVLLVAYKTDYNDNVNRFIIGARAKLIVFSRKIKNIELKYGYADFSSSYYGKMFIGDYCDYYMNGDKWINSKYPNGNIFDDNGFSRYYKFYNKAVLSNNWQFELLNNGIFRCNGWGSYPANVETIVELPFAMLSKNCDIIVRSVNLGTNENNIKIRLIDGRHIGITPTISDVISVIINYVWTYNKPNFDRESYNVIPGPASAVQRQKKLKVFKFKNISKHTFYPSFVA